MITCQTQYRVNIVFFIALISALALTMMSASDCLADLTIHQPLRRSVYQTNEVIPLAVVHDNSDQSAKLVVTVTRDGGIGTSYTFDVGASDTRKTGVTTDHVNLNGRLLRPGQYTVSVSVGDQSANAEFEVFSQVRSSSYRLINWGTAEKENRLEIGDSKYGYNLFYGQGGSDPNGYFIRAGVDFVPNCVMGGGHQMNLRMECDWSDPYAVRGGMISAAKFALRDRTLPNVPMIHFFDEPGLTWHEDSVSGDLTAHGVPAQVRAYEAAFNKTYLSHHEVDADKPESLAQWKHWTKWKLGFMDAAWKLGQHSVSDIDSSMLSVTQSQYGFPAFTDGYYFNVARSLPIVSGHGGYHDWGPGFFNPGMTLSISRGRDHEKECWYLPTWYANTTNDQYRVEQYLSFITGIQGLMSPPPLEPTKNPIAREAIIETNSVMGKLGTIFSTMPVTYQPVAMLYSISNGLDEQARSLTDKKIYYAHDTAHGDSLPFTYLAGKLNQQHFMTVVEEDIIDGTLAQRYKVLVIGAVSYLGDGVINALEDYIADGGKVLVYDSTVVIEGAIDLGVKAELPEQAKFDELQKTGDRDSYLPLSTTAKFLDGAKALAQAIGTHLDEAGINPVIETDVPTIVAIKHGYGDVMYVFALNATPDRAEGSSIDPIAVDATIGVPTEGRAIYDAMAGGAASGLTVKDGVASGQLAFGAGQLRVWALTSQPIGKVSLSAPVVTHDLTQHEQPITLNLTATVLDDQSNVLSGAIPMRVTVTDPNGEVRYELHRATDRGVLELALPMAGNDADGAWQVTVTELLANTQGERSFAYQSLKRPASTAGLTERAVAFGGDLQHVFEFARRHHDVTIVVGDSDYNRSAAERLKKILEPWDMRCTIVDAASVGPRPIIEAEAPTWSGGYTHTRRDTVKPGQENGVEYVGFNLMGPTILIGNPDDHAVIKFLAEPRWGFLPYAPKRNVFPGGSRGYVAWQRDAVQRGVESVTLIAYDKTGMHEAVGSFYEAAIGMEPLTQWVQPVAVSKSNP